MCSVGLRAPQGVYLQSQRCTARISSYSARTSHVASCKASGIPAQVALTSRRNTLKQMAVSSLVVCAAGAGAEAATGTMATPAEPQEAWRQGQQWEFNGHTVRWTVLNRDSPGTPLLLVHGFGASLEHWRFNAPALSGDRPVYAIDLLGFGYSDKPTVPNGFKCWGGHVWARQLCSFIDEIVQKPVVLVGNSLGGYSALLAAAAGSTTKGSIAGLVLVNSAGPLVEDGKQDDPFWELADTLEALDAVDSTETNFSLKGFFKKTSAWFGFQVLRTEKRVLGILGSVYTDSKENVDADLAKLILGPAFTPNSFEVFYATTVGGNGKPGISVNRLLEMLQARDTPTALLWGVNDPWITTKKAQRILELDPAADYLPIAAGHCPHDEKPAEFNAELNKWLAMRSL